MAKTTKIRPKLYSNKPKFSSISIYLPIQSISLYLILYVDSCWRSRAHYLFSSNNNHFPHWSGDMTWQPSSPNPASITFHISTSPILCCLTFPIRRILKGHRWSHLVGFNYSYWVGMNQYILIIIVQVVICARVEIHTCKIPRINRVYTACGREEATCWVALLCQNVELYRGSGPASKRAWGVLHGSLVCLFLPWQLSLSLYPSFSSSTCPLFRTPVVLEWCTFVHPVTSLPVFPHLFSLLSVPSPPPPPTPRPNPPSHLFSLPRWL